MPTPNELMEERANVFAQAEDFLARSDRGDELSAEDLASLGPPTSAPRSSKLQAEQADRTAKIKASHEQIDEAAEPRRRRLRPHPRGARQRQGAQRRLRRLPPRR